MLLFLVRSLLFGTMINLVSALTPLQLVIATELSLGALVVQPELESQNFLVVTQLQ